PATTPTPTPLTAGKRRFTVLSRRKNLRFVPYMLLSWVTQAQVVWSGVLLPRNLLAINPVAEACAQPAQTASVR
ncbi:MAG: hypothetical protein ABF569_03300, partial [Acetobacter sp.]|uniref:hypothetical protein n=1 Tax=Acetobacter sp. TaxID=440 RepID=UPI0039EBD596